MSEEEIIENAKNFISIDILYGGRIVLLKSQLKFYQNTIQELLTSYKNLKEIEKSHQEENGKLRVELEQEKEKNKDLEEKLKIAVAMLTKGTYPEKNEGDNDFDKKFIAVDKIKEKLEHQNMLWNTPNRQKEYNQEFAEFLEELLEEK